MMWRKKDTLFGNDSMRYEIRMEIYFNVWIEMTGVRSWFLNFASMVYSSASSSGARSLNYFGSSNPLASPHLFFRLARLIPWPIVLATNSCRLARCLDLII
jgi:hypothetical protein